MGRAGVDAVPGRITEAREARQYNISELAEKIGVTRQAVSRYEQGINKVSIGVLEKLCSELDFPMDFFYKQPEENQIREGAIFFRSRKTAEAKIRQMVKIKCNWTYEVYHYLNQVVVLPEFELPNMDLLLNYDCLTQEHIEYAAAALRSFWGIGDQPIDNLVNLLERKGFIITNSKTICAKTDACSFIKNGTPVIFLGSGDKSAYRVRFSLAHELGHIILHSHIEDEDLKDSGIAKRLEKEADQFAGAFLMPETTFSLDVRSVSLNYFLSLKRKWKVSIAAMVYRCKTMGLIDENQVLVLNKQISYRKWRTVEPLDDELPIEKPILLKSAIDLLLKNSVISKNDFVNTFRWGIKDLADVCGCDESYFELSPPPKLTLRIV